MLSITNDNLDLVLDNVTEIRDLTLQAKNGTYSDEEVEAMQEEAQQCIAEIDRLSENSKFSQLDLFGGKLATYGISFQAGLYSGENNTIAIDSALGIFNSVKFDDILKYTTKEVSNEAVDAFGDIQTIAGSKIAIKITDTNEIILKTGEADFSAEDDGKIYYIATNDSKEGYYEIKKNGNSYEINGLKSIYQYKGEVNSKSALIDIENAKVGDIYTVNNKAYEYKWESNEGFVWVESDFSIAENVVPKDIEIKPFDENSDDKKFNLLKIKYSDKAFKEALNALDGAINDITNRQTKIGSVQNRLASALDTLTIQFTNLSSAKSIITDVDVAAEASNYTQNQILQQVSASLLAQANQSPAIALSLL